MSWALYNHNVPVIPPSFSPPSVTEIDAETIFTGVPDFASSPEGMFAVAPGGRIMALPEGKTTDLLTTPVMYSSDGGDSWTETGVIPVAPTSNTYIASRIIYSSFHDAWFCSFRWVNFDSEVYYSLNNGASWTAMGFAGDNDHPRRYTARNIQLDDSGALYVIGRLGSPNDVAVHRYPNPLAGKGTYTRSATINNANASDMHWVGNNLTFHIRVPFGVGGSTPRIYWIAKNFGAGDAINYIGDLGGSTHPVFPHVSDGLENTLARADSNTSASTGTSYYPVTVDTVNPLVAENLVMSVACSKPYVPGYGNSHFLFGHRPSANLNIYLLSHSQDGENWSSEITLNLDAPRSGDNSMMRLLSGSTWLVSIVSESKMRILKFVYGVSASPAPIDGALSKEVVKQSPDIFYKLDDTGTPASVVDIGRKNYPNTVAQTITLEQTGLVSDGGTAALFGTGKIRATVTATTSTWTVDKSRPPIVNGMADDGGQIYEGSLVGGLVATAIGGYNFVTVEVYLQMLGLEPTGGADNHVHLFILSHNDTAATRLLLSYGDAFKLELAADHKLVFTAGAETLTSTAAITADTATLAILSIEKYGGKVNLYIQDGHEGFKAFTLTVPAVKSVVLGGQWDGAAYTGDADGVTVDYYAMIPFGNADIGALQDAWGVTATPPDAPVVTIGTANLLVKADAAPVLRNHYSTQQAQWQQVYGITNHATGAQDVHYSVEGGPGVIDLNDGKFGGSVSTAGRASSFGLRLPDTEPVWTGFHKLGIGTRDFTLAGWVKPLSASRQFYLGSAQAYARVGGIDVIYGGLTLKGGVDSMSVRVGRSLDGALSPEGQNHPWAYFLALSGFANPAAINAWSYVTLCRRSLQWYVTVNGGFASSIAYVYGNSAAAIVSVPNSEGMNIGKEILVSGVPPIVSSHAPPAKYDDVLFVLDEALYTQEFTPPTTAFEI